MIVGVLAMAAANAAVCLGARGLMERLRIGRPAVDGVLFLLLRLLIISAVVLLAGLTRVLHPWTLGGFGLLALGGLAALGVHRRLPRWRRPSCGPGWTILAVAVALRLLLQTWFFAPYLDDTLAYHLPKIAEWVRAGGFNGELGVDARATFPAGFELLETWWVVFLHHDVLIEVAGIEMLVLAGASVAALASEMGWGTRTSGIAAMLFVLNPALQLQATSCANDGAVTALVLASLALLVGGAGPLLILLPLALGAGIKPTFLYTLPGLALVAALIPRGDGPTVSSTKLLVVVAASALLVGSFWYLHNWAIYGNPIYPMGPGGMRRMDNGSSLQRLGPSWKGLLENLQCLFDIRIYDSLAAPDAFCTSTYGWGPAGFALGSLALIPVLRTDALLRRLALGAAVSGICVLALVELDPWYGRFLVFLAALPALALARLWDRYRFVPLLGSLAILVQFLGTMVPGNMRPETLRNLVHQRWTDRTAQPAPSESAGQVVGFATDDFGASYPLYLPSYSRSVVYLRDETLDALLSHLDRDSVTVLYVSGAMVRRGPLLEEGVRRGRLRPVTHGAWKGYAVLPGR